MALASVDSDVAPYESVKDLPYLDAVINEGNRLHSTVGAGLPRVVGAGGADILGRHFEEGTVVSVPGYHVHRDEAIWGPDAATFRPERWIEATGERKKRMMEAFVPFSVGPRYAAVSDHLAVVLRRSYRVCIGRSLAAQQLHVILATLLRRYDFTVKPGAQVSRILGHIRTPTTPSNAHMF